MRSPEARSRRRLWPVFVPLALVAAVGIVWSGFWYYAASAAEATMADWMAREARVGRIYTCSRQTLGGFPFRIEVRCIEPSVELRGAQPLAALKAGDLRVAAQIYEPTLLIGEFAGPLLVGMPGQQPEYRATWQLGQSSVRGTPNAPERVSVVFEQPRVQRLDSNSEINVMTAKHVELQRPHGARLCYRSPGCRGGA